MNFEGFLKRYNIEEYNSYGFDVHSVVMERETLINMLTDLYTEGYNDGSAGEKLIRLQFDQNCA